MVRGVCVGVQGTMCACVQGPCREQGVGVQSLWRPHDLVKQLEEVLLAKWCEHHLHQGHGQVGLSMRPGVG